MGHRRLGDQETRHLVAACADGDERAWLALRDLVCHLCRTQCRSAAPCLADPEDVAAIVLHRLCADGYRYLRLFRPELGGLVPWLRVVVRGAYAQVRRSPRWHLSRGLSALADDEGALWDGQPWPEKEALRRELQERVRRQLLHLPPKTQRLLRLHYVEARPYAEVAAATGVPAAAIRQQARRARERLRVALESEGLGSADVAEYLGATDGMPVRQHSRPGPD